MAEFSFICKRTVCSTKPVEPGKFIPLSVLDRIMERNHLRLVFYYRFPRRRRAGELTRELTESLSEMLSFFPIVTGRLLRTPDGQWMIKCNDAGLRVVEARMNSTVDQWLQNVDREKELKLVHWEDMFHKPYFWSTFYVQITEFEEGGMAIGLSCTHLLSDPISLTMIIKAWADTFLKGESTDLPLFHPLPSQRQGNQTMKNQPFGRLIDHYKSAIQETGPISDTKKSTIVIHFNQEMVRSCIAMAGRCDRGTGLTPFEALTALFWTRISKLKGTKTGLIDMCVCLDMRKVLALEKNFFGNCMVFKKVHGDEIDPNSVSKAADLIKETVSRIDGDEVVSLIEWLERENWENLPWMNGSELICVNLENLESCSAIFEEHANLLRLSCYIEPAVGPGQIIVLPSQGDDDVYSRVVVVTLPEDEARKLLEDALIKQLAPTLLMGLNNKAS